MQSLCIGNRKIHLTLHALKLDDQTFEKIVKANPEGNFEQTAGGELVVVPPTGGTSGNKNSNLSYQLEGWNLASDAGRTFDSNTTFVLPNKARANARCFLGEARSLGD